jgi:hypothetical protein
MMGRYLDWLQDIHADEAVFLKDLVPDPYGNDFVPEEPVKRLIETAEREIEGLRVCGTCTSWEAPDEQGYTGCWAASTEEIDPEPRRTDACHFTPSRWTPYWAE